jgi:hypothetical protein
METVEYPVSPDEAMEALRKAQSGTELKLIDYGPSPPMTRWYDVRARNLFEDAVRTAGNELTTFAYNTAPGVMTYDERQPRGEDLLTHQDELKRLAESFTTFPDLSEKDKYVAEVLGAWNELQYQLAKSVREGGEVWERSGPFVREALRSWEVSKEVAEYMGSTRAWFESRPEWEKWTPVWGQIIEFGSKSPLELLEALPPVYMANQATMGWGSVEGVSHVVESLLDEVLFKDKATFLDTAVPPKFRHLLEDVGVFDVINAQFKAGAGATISDTIEIAATVGSGGRLLTLGTKALKGAVTKILSRYAIKDLLGSSFLMYMIGDKISDAVRDNTQSMEDIADFVVEYFGETFNENATVGPEETEVITTKSEDSSIVEEPVSDESMVKVPDADMSETIFPQKGVINEREAELTETETIEDKEKPDTGFDWSMLAPAVGGLLGGLVRGVVDGEDTVTLSSPKGGGGSGPATVPAYCELEIKEAIEKGDISTVPPECMPLLNKMKEEVNGHDSRKFRPSNRSSRTSKPRSRKNGRRVFDRSENSSVEFGSPGLDTLSYV